MSKNMIISKYIIRLFIYLFVSAQDAPRKHTAERSARFSMNLSQNFQINVFYFRVVLP